MINRINARLARLQNRASNRERAQAVSQIMQNARTAGSPAQSSGGGS